MKKFKSFLSPQLEEFCEHLRASNRLTTMCELNLHRFDKYCYQIHTNTTILSQALIDAWCVKKETENKLSRNKRIHGVIQFIRYLNESELVNITEPLLLKAERKTHIPHIFTETELEYFFHACDTFCPNPRDKSQAIRKLTVPVFFRLLYSTGMRPMEARLLKVENVNFEQGVLSIKETKGYSQHFIVLHDSMHEVLMTYNQEIRQYYPNREYFFTSNKHHHHYKKEWVNHNFNEMWFTYNEAKGVRPYDLRYPNLNKILTF